MHLNCLAVHLARKLWRDYFASGVDGVVFIVDAVDRARFPEAKKELDVRINVFLFGTKIDVEWSLYAGVACIGGVSQRSFSCAGE